MTIEKKNHPNNWPVHDDVGRKPAGGLPDGAYEKITDKEAVELAEWLGFVEEEFYPWGDRSKPIEKRWACKRLKQQFYDIDSLKYWLYSAEGQEALMDKLSAAGVYVKTFPFNKYVGEEYSHENRLTEKDNFLRESLLATGNGPTRQDALIKATLELIRKGEGNHAKTDE